MLIVGVEKFHSFREVHTPNWHQRRHQVAQAFLDQFMRKVSGTFLKTDF